MPALPTTGSTPTGQVASVWVVAAVALATGIGAVVHGVDVELVVVEGAVVEGAVVALVKHD